MPVPLTLSITTRGIGINLCSFYANVVSLVCITEDDDDPKVELPNIYASYRALLALVESRLYNILRPQEDVYRYSPLLRDYYNIMNIPIIFTRYLEAINILEYKDIIYFPGMPNNTVIGGKFIPRPENIILSNLRQTVETLKASDVHDDDALQHRKNFYRYNPIPGAIWDKNTYKLINADEIIPPNYSLHNDVYNDMHKLLSLSMKLSHNSKYINKYCANRNDNRKSFSSFICNKLGDLRVPDRESEQNLNNYYWNSSILRSDIDTFYSRFKLRSDNVIKEGTLFLLGEYPNNESFAKPIYEVRSEDVNSYFYAYRSYHASYSSYHRD